MDLKQMLRSMTLEQKIGQLIIAGFETPQPDDPHFLKLVNEYHVGNIILFTRNLGSRNEVAQLTQAIRNTIMDDCGVPPFIVCDQEGGMVTRIFHAGNVVPGAMATGATYDPENAYKIGKIVGQEMRALGMNFNYAPCVEEALFRTPSNISVRAYSDNPFMVALFCNAFVAGLQEQGVIATLKHFPGYTGVLEDAHLEIPTNVRSRHELEKVELAAFQQVIDGGADAVMTGFLKCPALVPDGGLTAASYEVMTGLLKEKMGFEGIVSSDCMDMRGLLDAYGADRGAVALIKAGVHVLCISHNLSTQATACDGLREAVLSGEIPMEQLDEIVLHILRFKEKYHLFEEKPIAERLASVDWEENRRICERISEDSVTLVRGGELLPLKGKGLFISTKPMTLVIVDEKVEAGDTFAHAAAQRFGGESRVIGLNPTDEEIEALTQAAKGKDYVVLGTYNAFCNEGQQKLQQALLRANPKLISVALRASYDYDCAQDVPCLILTYEYTKNAIRSVLRVLGGEREATGVAPVRL